MKRISFLAAFFITVFSMNPWVVNSEEEASNSAVDLNVIKENVKQRLEKYVKGQSDELGKSISYMGVLESIATTTLSIKTDEGIKLASTSATTTFVRLPKSTKVKLDDVGIEEYVVAIGQLDSSEVLNAKRVLVQKDPPKEPVNQAEYGTIQSISNNAKVITLAYPSGTTKSFVITKQSALNMGSTPDNITKISVKTIQTGVPALVVFTPAQNEEDDNTVVHLLVRAEPPPPDSTPTPKPSPTPKSTPTPKKTTVVE